MSMESILGNAGTPLESPGPEANRYAVGSISKKEVGVNIANGRHA